MFVPKISPWAVAEAQKRFTYRMMAHTEYGMGISLLSSRKPLPNPAMSDISFEILPRKLKIRILTNKSWPSVQSITTALGVLWVISQPCSYSMWRKTPSKALSRFEFLPKYSSGLHAKSSIPWCGVPIIEWLHVIRTALSIPSFDEIGSWIGWR